MSLLEVKDLTVRRGGKTIVESVSFALEAGEWLMLAGPNGAGKSTCVSAIAQCAPYTGEVLAGGGDARRMKPARLAREIAVLEQTHAVEYAFTVEEIVRMGRYAHERGFFSARTGSVRQRSPSQARQTARTGQRVHCGAPFGRHTVAPSSISASL